MIHESCGRYGCGYGEHSPVYHVELRIIHQHPMSLEDAMTTSCPQYLEWLVSCFKTILSRDEENVFSVCVSISPLVVDGQTPLCTIW